MPTSGDVAQGVQPLAGDPRLSWRQRRTLRTRVGRERRPCGICGQPIDYAQPWDLDEITPRALGGDPLAYSNVRPAHTYCNRSKGAGIRAKANPPGLRRPRIRLTTPLEATEW